MTTPIYQVMPPLDEAEYESLRAEIAERGVLVPVVKDQHGNILDGHHRMQIAEQLGVKYRVDVVQVRDEREARSLARMYNLARRHLSREQKRQMIADEIREDPERSDRAIARVIGCDHKTVGSVRRELSGELPQPGGRLTVPRNDAEVAGLVLDAITRRYDEAEGTEAQRSWAMALQLADGIYDWGNSTTANLFWFGQVAQQMYGMCTDLDVWEVLAVWMVPVAENALAEVAELRAEKPFDWRLPGELLAEITVALWSPKVSRDMREHMFGAMKDKVMVGMAETSPWWPIPQGDAVLPHAQAAEVYAAVALAAGGAA